MRNQEDMVKPHPNPVSLRVLLVNLTLFILYKSILERVFAVSFTNRLKVPTPQEVLLGKGKVPTSLIIFQKEVDDYDKDWRPY